jgi:hypothetical protein
VKRVVSFAARLLVGAALLAVLGIGVVSLVPPVEARPGCLCPAIVAPVICDNGKTYINQCRANCDHARNCVPTGDI